MNNIFIKSKDNYVRWSTFHISKRDKINDDKLNKELDIVKELLKNNRDFKDIESLLKDDIERSISSEFKGTDKVKDSEDDRYRWVAITYLIGITLLSFFAIFYTDVTSDIPII